MDPMTIGLLAKFVPSIVGWISGDDAEEKTNKVVDVVKKVTGVDEPNEAISMVEANPELRAELQKEILNVQLEHERELTKRLETINATMRAEYTSNDKFVSRWRPTFGYIVSFTWGVQMLSLSVLIVTKPEQAVNVMSAMVGLTALWGIALTILGVNVNKRSQDKAVAKGQPLQPGIMNAIAQRIMKK